MTSAEARFNKSLRPRKAEGSLGRTAQDVHLDSHTAPELCKKNKERRHIILSQCSGAETAALRQVVLAYGDTVCNVTRRSDADVRTPPASTDSDPVSNPVWFIFLSDL